MYFFEFLHKFFMIFQKVLFCAIFSHRVCDFKLLVFVWSVYLSIYTPPQNRGVTMYWKIWASLSSKETCVTHPTAEIFHDIVRVTT